MRLGYDLHFEIPQPVAMATMLHVHPSRQADLLAPDRMTVEPATRLEEYRDAYGNRCTRLSAPAGLLKLSADFLIRDPGEPDAVDEQAGEVPVEELPAETLVYLMNSRYCEVDKLGAVAVELFGSAKPGWSRVQAVCDWVHSRIVFGYSHARATKSALDVYTERLGVCRDYQHLAITFCRALNIPARYATGYLGDIRIPPAPYPMDFSAWFEAYLGGRWWTFDARHNRPRVGRVLMAVGRDATDVALTTSFGAATLRKFFVVSEEVDEAAAPRP